MLGSGVSPTVTVKSQRLRTLRSRRFGWHLMTPSIDFKIATKKPDNKLLCDLSLDNREDKATPT